MQITVNNDGYVENFALLGNLTDGIEIDVPDDSAHFVAHFQSYHLQDSVLIFDAEKQAESENAAAVAALRIRREQTCFPVINRGELWYKHLSAEQTAELDAWYQAWLDVTETRIIPDMPGWIR